MKSKTPLPNHLFDQGKETWERTDQFEKQVNELRQELSANYQPLLNAEKNWFKRLLIKIQFLLEFNKKRNEVSSWKNLHVLSN